MIAALATLARDAWVLGIACAAALAYSVVTFLEALISFVLQLVDSTPVSEAAEGSAEEALVHAFGDQPYTFVVRDHYVHYAPLLSSALLLAIVLVAVAFILHATRNRDGASPGPDG